MDTLIADFGLDTAKFTQALANAHGIIAGSSVLSEFLRAAGQEPGFTPGDMDIWLLDRHSQYLHKEAFITLHRNAKKNQQEILKTRAERLTQEIAAAAERAISATRTLNSDDLRVAEAKYIDICEKLHTLRVNQQDDLINTAAIRKHIDAQSTALLDLIRTSGYRVTANHSQTANLYYGYVIKITSVEEFTNDAGKKLQLITVKVNRHLSKYIKGAFDLSCCMAWWDPHTGAISHHYPEFTLKRLMVPLNCPESEKRLKRQEKYAARGFMLRESFEEPPTIAADSEWHKIECLDILSYDEQPVATYLSAGGRVVIKSGEQYYGFTRKALVSYLQAHRQNSGVYKMPIGQLVLREDMQSVQDIKNFVFAVAPPPIATKATNSLKVLAV